VEVIGRLIGIFLMLCCVYLTRDILYSLYFIAKDGNISSAEKGQKQIMKNLRLWLVKKLLGKDLSRLLRYKEVLWKLIDEENAKEEPFCPYVEAWLIALDRIGGVVEKGK